MHKQKISSKKKNLTHPSTPAVAHFIISDPWLGVKAVTASVKKLWFTQSKTPTKLTKVILNSLTNNSASVSYQLNLFSFNNFHNGIRLTHLLHPLLLPSLGQRSFFFFSLRHQQHTHLSLALPPLSCETDPGSTDPVFLLPPLPTKQE